MTIPFVIGGTVLVLALWGVFYLFLKRRLSKYKDAASGPFNVEKEISYCWAVSIACLVIAGLSLVITAINCPTHDFAPEIYRFFKVYSGIGFLGLALPIFWLVVRNQELASEILRRKAKEEELEQSNTKLSHAIEELRTAQRQLVESERMKALGEMAAGIAHDFNNSLMPILGYSNYLATDPNALDNKNEARGMLKEIATASKDAKEIVRRLKEFYKHKDEAPHEPMDVNQIVAGSVSLTRPRWQTEKQAEGHTVEVKTDLAKVLPVVMGNESQLREALINLILNAVDAIPESGTITLRTTADTKWAVIEVIDTGMGMTEDARQRCLEPFFTTKKMGSGLGLSMVLGILRRHNGEVEVKSEQGKGTTVILRFPIGIGTPVAGEAAETGGVRFDKSLRVLVVDDDARVRETLKRFLEAGSHTVELAETGAEGLERQRKGTFDLVIVDRAMPDMGGDKLAGMIKEKNPDLPIIMLTGFGGVIEATPQAPKNVDTILAKPVAYRELQAAIAELMIDEPEVRSQRSEVR